MRNGKCGRKPRVGFWIFETFTVLDFSYKWQPWEISSRAMPSQPNQVEKKPIPAQSVRKHLGLLAIWRSMCSLILETSRTNVQTTEKHLLKEIIWRGTSSLTVERGGTIVTNARACTLKRYMLLTHVQSSNKPYKCSQCSYASSVARHLQGHIRTHSLQKTKKCHKCDYSTIYLSNLKKNIWPRIAQKRSIWWSKQQINRTNVIGVNFLQCIGEVKTTWNDSHWWKAFQLQLLWICCQ